MLNKFKILLIFFLGLVFFRWFGSNEIVGTDWPYFFNETLKQFPPLVPSWNTWQGNGLGWTNPAYFIQIFQNFTVIFYNWFNIPWIFVYKLLWFGLFVILSAFSMNYLLNIVLPPRKDFMKVIGIIIFATNTYILMIVDGGQMGVALSYSVAPLVLGIFIKLIKSFNLKNKICLSLSAGLALGIQVMFDPRIAYLVILCVFLYLIVHYGRELFNLSKLLNLFFYVFLIPGSIAILLHASWLLPSFLFRETLSGNFGEVYSGIGIVKFLSFASFSQSLSLLHPNWPENIFGKSYFMRPEFLPLPLIAFSSLVFLKKSRDLIENKFLIFFLTLGLIGSFLSKGANDPFGGIYLWFFSHVPGFVLFRDSTKFYLFTIIAYSILIPFTLELLGQKINIYFKKLKFISLYSLVFIFFIAFWLFLIRPVILGQLNGTFKVHEVPKEYVELKDFLNNQPEFSRVLWVPIQQRFRFFSNEHPPVDAVSLFNATNSAEIVKKIKEKSTEEYISNLSIKYLIVPYDSLGEIFLKDRKYDDTSYRLVVKGVESVNWLKEIKRFGKIVVFENPQAKSHIFLEGNGKVSSEMLSPINYEVNISISSPQTLIFSESYDSSWIIQENNKIIRSIKTKDGINSFVLNKTGIYSFNIHFSKDRYFQYGQVISIITLLIVLALLIILKNHCAQKKS